MVFATELLSQLRNRGIDWDRISQIRARQDGKHLDKTSNTKYAAQIITEQIQGWLPLKAADPDSQHEITQLRNQLADDGSALTRPGQASSSSQASPINWLLDHLPAGLTARAFNTWLKALTIPVAQEAVLTTNLKKAEDWWANQPSSADRAESGDHDGHPSPKTQQEL